MNRRQGFTLVELTATLMLAAILAATVSFSLKGIRRDTTVEDVASQLRAYDLSTREQARLLGRPLVMRIATDGRMSRLDPATSLPRGVPLVFHVGLEGVHLEQVATDQEGITAGDVDIACSAAGQTPSYAVLLSGPSGRRQWIFFAGLTGENRTMQNDRQVQQTLGLVGAQGANGNDAD